MASLTSASPVASCSARCTPPGGGSGGGGLARAAAAAAPRRRRSPAALRAFTLEPASGGPPLAFNTPRVTVGSAPEAGVCVSAPGVEPEHAALTQKGRQVFLTALVGESVFDATGTWVDGVEARARVAYVLAAGSTLAFGAAGGDAAGAAAFVVRFEEPSGANPLVEMLIQGVAAGASPEVRRALEGNK